MTRDEAVAYIEQVDAAACREFVVHSGTRVMWRRFGSGSPLLLLHGGHGSWLHWVRNICTLSASHELWIPDMPGYGDSDALPPEAGLNELLETLTANVNILTRDAGSIALAGFSFGGLVATHLASRLEQVSRLVLLGAAGHGGSRRQLAELANWRTCTSEADLEAVMRSNLAIHMLSDPTAIDGLALEAHIRSCRRTRFKSRAISRRGGLADALACCTMPTLLLWGENDVTVTPDETMVRLAALSPGVSGSTISGAGHWVAFEAAEAVNKQVSLWLSGAKAQSIPKCHATP